MENLKVKRWNVFDAVREVFALKLNVQDELCL